MYNNGQQETAALVALVLDNFRKDTEYREQHGGTRSGRRTTQLIRFGMTGLSVPGLILFYPAFTLTTDFSRITRT